jgi:hypothetical protein
MSRAVSLILTKMRVVGWPLLVAHDCLLRLKVGLPALFAQRTQQGR